jgi:thymidylate synthase ThyX
MEGPFLELRSPLQKIFSTPTIRNPQKPNKNLRTIPGKTRMNKRILPDGSKLFLVDDLSPEDEAMLQALYSRSAESVETHLEKVKQTTSGKFMSTYYVGYGHKSIADCGTTTLFLEGVSLLAAKAVQDWPLYSGQETSTRYIDMSKQRIVDPVGTPASKAILDRWMAFYTSNQDRVVETIRQRHPKLPNEKEDVYERAVKARSFDVLRGFLPAGITTQLSWHTNLRQAGDHLTMISKHPAAEIQNLGVSLQGLLGESYPSSGVGLNLASVAGVALKSAGAEDRAKWEQTVVNAYTFFNRRRPPFMTTILNADLKPYEEILASRPRGSVLPHFMTDLGQLHFWFQLDFGSFRDIQRHRNGVCRMPLLTTDYGFETWYLNQLDPDLAGRASKLILEQTQEINNISDNPVERQYYTALGFLVNCDVMYGLPAALYVMELRSSKTVHPTLRKVVHGIISDFRKNYPDVALHVDMDSDDWDVRRGTQTITTK